MTQSNTFALRLLRAMQVRKMKTAEIAEAVGVSPQTISNWLNRNSWPVLSTARDAASVLEVSLDWLSGNTDEDPDWGAPPAAAGEAAGTS